MGLGDFGGTWWDLVGLGYLKVGLGATFQNSPPGVVNIPD